MKRIKGWILWGMLLGLLSLCPAGLAAHDERLPEEINAILSGPAWDGYEVTAVDNLATPVTARRTMAAVLSKGERNVLCVFSNATAEWKLVVKREKALYAGDQLVNLNFPDENLVISYGFDDRIEEYCFSPEGKKKEKWKMKWVRILTDIDMNPQTTDRSAEVVEIKPTGDGLSYRGYHEETDKLEIETAKKTTVSGVIYTDLDQFGIYAFPRSLSKARERLTQPLALPVNTQRDALPQGRTGAFRSDEQYPVYSGPADTYARGANGKASVSTNDWIQVFGCENDRVLIQYAISSEKARFGYIPADALKGKERPETLELAYLPASVRTACALTDDPLKARGAIAQLAVGESLLYLGTFGGDWTYVETLTEPRMRGFVPSDAVMIAE